MALLKLALTYTSEGLSKEFNAWACELSCSVPMSRVVLFVFRTLFHTQDVAKGVQRSRCGARSWEPCPLACLRGEPTVLCPVEEGLGMG